MDLGWKRLIPLSLGWLLVVAGVIVSVAWGFALLGAGVVGAGLLYQAVRVGRRRRDTGAVVTGGGRAAGMTRLVATLDPEKSGS